MVDDVSLVLKYGILGLVLMILQISQELLNLEVWVDFTSSWDLYILGDLSVQLVFFGLQVILGNLSAQWREP